MVLLKPPLATQAHHPQDRRHRPRSPAQHRPQPQYLHVAPHRLGKEGGERRPNRYNRFRQRHQHRGTLLMGLVTRIGCPIDVSAYFLLVSEPQNGQSRDIRDFRYSSFPRMRESSSLLKRMYTRFRGYDGKSQVSERPESKQFRLSATAPPTRKAQRRDPCASCPIPCSTSSLGKRSSQC